MSDFPQDFNYRTLGRRRAIFAYLFTVSGLPAMT